MLKDPERELQRFIRFFRIRCEENLGMRVLTSSYLTSSHKSILPRAIRSARRRTKQMRLLHPRNRTFSTEESATGARNSPVPPISHQQRQKGQVRMQAQQPTIVHGQSVPGGSEFTSWTAGCIISRSSRTTNRIEFSSDKAMLRSMAPLFCMGTLLFRCRFPFFCGMTAVHR